ncbi:lipase family protein [Crocosphaera sp.]|uniref:lipase family protein n=1 Tax=Crocosphaera sp. TaxID=2729996 RepID=UPI003F28E520|nr:lipase family protein [Crocosphaera sp.]
MLNFNSQTTRYSPWNAYYLGQAASIVYEESSVIQKTTKVKWQMPKYKFIQDLNKDDNEITGTECFVAGDEKKIIVSFRGTQVDQKEDVLTDINLKLIDGPLGEVHRGFLRGVDSVWEELLETIKEFQDQGQSLWFTGHSLGAALANITVAKLIDDLDKPVYGLYTFGQPRVGNRTFARNFNIEFKSRYFRFVNNNDVVTRIPLRSMSYSHAGNFLYFDTDKVLHSDLHWWYVFVDNIGGVMEDFGKIGLDNIKDHDMSDYIAGLEKNKTLQLHF